MGVVERKGVIGINRVGVLATLGGVETKLAGVAAQSPGTAFLEVGALVRQRQLERYALEERRARLIHTALTYVGHPQTRNRGTVGGSLAHADPSAELPLLFLILGGTAIIQSTRGERKVAAEEFFQSYFTTAIEPDEMLTKTLWPLPAPDEGIAFKEYRRRHGDFALLAAACTMKIGSHRTEQHVRLGLVGVADTPLLIAEVLKFLVEHWATERVRCHLSGKIYCFSENLPRCQALSADRLSHIIWRGIGNSSFSVLLFSSSSDLAAHSPGYLGNAPTNGS